MDTYKYIRSKDIREYNQKIEHKFSALESAFLVWRNCDLTLEEKHEGWREIMHDMPDEQIKYHDRQSYDSLFALLIQFINDDNTLVKEFYKKNNQSVYSCKYTDDIDSGDWFTDFGRIYANFDDMQHKLSKIIPSHDKCIVVYTKKYFSSPYKKVELIVNNQQQIINVDGCEILNNATVKKNKFFQSFWMDIPTPFKVGDIVCGSTAPLCCGRHIACEEPFVLKSISNWDGETAEQRGEKLTSKDKFYKTKNVERLRESGNIRDMAAFGYFSHVIWSDQIDGEFYSSSMYDYVDLEYYRGNIKDGARILLPLSSYIKGEINEELLIRLCEIIKKQEELKRAMLLLDLSPEQLYDLGIE